MNAKRRPERDAIAALDQSNSPQDTSLAELEAVYRVHTVALVLDAVDAGDWPLDLDIIDGAVAILEAAARWALLAELEAVA